MTKINTYQVDYHVRGKRIFLKKYNDAPDIRNTTIDARNATDARKKFRKKFPNRTIDRVVIFWSR